MNPPNPILTQGSWKITKGNNIPIIHPSWFALRPNVVYSVPFRPKRTENLVPTCKPVRGTPMFHLGQNFGLFRPVSAGICNSARILFWLLIFFFSASSVLLRPFFFFFLHLTPTPTRIRVSRSGGGRHSGLLVKVESATAL